MKSDEINRNQLQSWLIQNVQKIELKKRKISKIPYKKEFITELSVLHVVLYILCTFKGHHNFIKLEIMEKTTVEFSSKEFVNSI